jgi:hypothetical protein
MPANDSTATATVVAAPVAGIDVGSRSIRMAIAQVSPDSSVEVLESLERTASLGADTFRRGRLAPETLRAAIAILRDYKRLLDTYNVQKVRAVATSAVREAGKSPVTAAAAHAFGRNRASALRQFFDKELRCGQGLARLPHLPLRPRDRGQGRCLAVPQGRTRDFALASWCLPLTILPLKQSRLERI